MRHYAFCREDGVVQAVSSLSDEVEPEVPDGLTVVEVDAMLSGPHRLIGDEVLPYTIEPVLQEVRAAKWNEIKQARDAAEFGGFTWDGSRFDSDSESQSRIQGAAQLATLAQLASQTFSVDWTLQDNTVRTLSGADMIAAGTAMGQHIMAVHAIGRVLRAQIEEATTLGEVEAVQWPQ